MHPEADIVDSKKRTHGSSLMLLWEHFWGNIVTGMQRV